MGSPNPPIPAATARRLTTLLARTRRHERAYHDAFDQLAAATLAAVEAGASRRQLATLLGVGGSTVQDWVNRGRRNRVSG